MHYAEYELITPAIRSLALGVFASLAIGCNKPAVGDAVTGSWVGSPPLPAEIKNDPQLKEYISILEDSYTLVLNDDSTYRLDCWAEKKGTWQLTNRLVRFEESSSTSTINSIFTGELEIGNLNSAGKRTYTAVLSSDKKKLALQMGKMGEVSFHR